MNSKKLRFIKNVAAFLMLNCIVSFPLYAVGAINPPGPSSVSSMGAENGSTEKGYVIGATNLLFIKVLGEGGLQQTYRVDESGFITHPLVGRVKLAGQTVSQAEETIKRALTGDYILDPNVTIFILEHSRFSVLGEVRKPGNYEILGRLSLIEGISIAGGFTPLGNQKRVKILRRTESGENTLLINVEEIIDGKKEGIDIQAGDVIEIPKSFF